MVVKALETRVVNPVIEHRRWKRKCLKNQKRERRKNLRIKDLYSIGDLERDKYIENFQKRIFPDILFVKIKIILEINN